MNDTMTPASDLTIHRIVESQAPYFDPLTFLPTLTPELLEENRSWLEPHALDPATGKLILAVQSYIVRTPHHIVLVDTCIGNDKDRPAYPFWNQLTKPDWMNGLAALGLTVNDIDVVMCTHLHVDHVGWNTRLENGRWVPTFPNARYLFSKKEYDHWVAQNTTDPLPHIQDSVIPVVEAKRADFVTTDHAVDDHVRLTPTPGHTPDHFAVLLGKGKPAAVLSGDLIHSPLQARYPEISMRADFSPEQAAQTRRAFLQHHCEAGTICCTAHFPSPSRIRFKPWDNGFRCEPA
jgi:glyoxylase-like metal-dependent hydrolase (beta-lactamase superfamily II)